MPGTVRRGALLPAIQVGSYPSAKSRPCTWTTVYALSVLVGRHTITVRNVCYVDVRAVWHFLRIVSGVRTTTVSGSWPHFDRRGLSKIEQSPVLVIGRLCVPSLGRHTTVARNVCYIDVRVVWHVSRVVSGIYADTVSDVQSHIDRRGL